jgi:hypothetical protein
MGQASPTRCKCHSICFVFCSLPHVLFVKTMNLSGEERENWGERPTITENFQICCNTRIGRDLAPDLNSAISSARWKLHFNLLHLLVSACAVCERFKKLRFFLRWEKENWGEWPPDSRTPAVCCNKIERDPHLLMNETLYIVVEKRLLPNQASFS